MESQKIIYNQLPEQLKKETELKPGQKAIFTVLQKELDKRHNRWRVPESLPIPSTDRIVDPKDNTKEIDIAFEIKPGTFGDIVFTKSAIGSILLDGDNALDRIKYRYLRICRWNKDNADKKYHIAPNTYLFEEEKPELKSCDEREQRRLIREAEDIIDNMTVKELQELSKGLGLPYHTNENEMVVKLMNFAQKAPTRFLAQYKDFEVKYMADIQSAIDAGLITSNKGFWVWEDQKQQICVIPNGVPAKRALFEFFLTEKGAPVYKRIVQLLKTVALEQEEAGA